jgi:hypothetical protein
MEASSRHCDLPQREKVDHPWTAIFEQRVEQTVQALGLAVRVGKRDNHPKLPSWAFSWRVPPIKYLDYEHSDGEHAWLAVRKAFLRYTE